MMINLFQSFFLWEGAYLKVEIVYKGEQFSLRNTSRMQYIDFVG